MTPEAPAGQRLLLVMRHAKAVPYAPDDHDRALAPRGRADATEAGEWARRQGISPDVALVSSALRTQQTWECLAAPLECTLEVEPEDALYSAGPETALELVRSVDPSSRTVVVVGHNPTMGTLVHLLVDGEGDAAAMELVSTDYPTSTIAVFVIPGDWTDLEFGHARLVAAHTGRAASED